jgi:glycosyltransferase involved in cell wall biosynthesis
LYAGASALALPSLDEGFGLPALEAMALGIPVVASNAGALPEVVGDAGLLVDPADVGGLARALERVHVDGGLAVRLREAGIDRARQFNWTESVRTLLRAYEDALGRTVSSRRPKRGARA